LYLSGKKTAGSSILEDFQFCGDPLPNSGDHWIVLDSKKIPKCILKVVKVVQNKFLDVPLEIAIAEGEGDLSLKFWRETHIDFFNPYIEHWGLNNVEDSTIVTEFYEVVYK
jgi:5-formyltetrahydrofolate cyclo-ligase